MDRATMQVVYRVMDEVRHDGYGHDADMAFAELRTRLDELEAEALNKMAANEEKTKERREKSNARVMKTWKSMEPPVDTYELELDIALERAAREYPYEYNTEPPKNFFLKVAGKSFTCECGCNVFEKTAGGTGYSCNSCLAIYREGAEDVPQT